MVKRILLLGLAVVALAIALPAIVAQSGLGGGVAQAQTPPTTDPDDQADPPEAPDEADDARHPEPDTPDQGDTPVRTTRAAATTRTRRTRSSSCRPAPKTRHASGGGDVTWLRVPAATRSTRRNSSGPSERHSR